VALANDLLEQANFLSGREANKPKQASLRRAVSAAYYAVFHLLAEEAAAQATVAAPRGLSQRAQRALEHGEMKQAAQNFDGRQLPRHIQPLLSTPLSLELIGVARNFVQLQELRHEADYDVTAKFDRTTVQRQIKLAEQLFQNWNQIRGTEESKVFLAALMFGKRWNK